MKSLNNTSAKNLKNPPAKNIHRSQAVPCHIITGFLGVGKTSAIANLLKTKPSHERWAVLVNEFGEIGIDGSLFQGQSNTGQPNSGDEVFIREVPGGCMCCAAGLPMQIALNQLIARAKPDRLFIEPTGLGHPKEVMEVLSAEYYQDVLDIQKIITLVDARKLNDARYTEHNTFNQQIAIADVIVGNKQDLYGEGEQQALMDYVNNHAAAEAKIYFTEHGVLQEHWLQGATQFRQTGSTLSEPEPHAHQPVHHHPVHHHAPASEDINTQPFPACGFLSANNEGEGFNSIGWRFAPVKVFNADHIRSLLHGLLPSVERIKATLITTNGGASFNMTRDSQEETSITTPQESRLEIIASSLPDDLEQQVIACLKP